MSVLEAGRRIEKEIEIEAAKEPHPTFGFGGMKVHHMKCPECDNEANRTFEPGKGYT